MNRNFSAIPVAVLALLFELLTISRAHAMNHDLMLDKKQQSVVTIAAFTASGDLEKLTVALTDGLEAGLTVNEIKEVLVQMYAYAGFPRSLNGLFTLMSVLDERKAKGIVDQAGRDASSIPDNLNKDEYGAKVRASLAGLEGIPPPAAWQQFAPVIDVFLKEHLFADVFARDVLDFQQRELATIAALASMSGTGSQLRFHFGAAMNTGLTESQLKDFVSVLRDKVGAEEAESASEILAGVLEDRTN